MPPAHAVSVGLRPPLQLEIISPRHPPHESTVLPAPAGVFAPAQGTGVSHERSYHDHLEEVESVLGAICRRKHLSAADADDFRQQAHLTLIQRGIFDKIDSKSSVRAFLMVVLTRVYKDFRIAQWGKWRPSVEAQRHGDVAILLERLIVRDGLSFEEALETMRTNHGVAESRATLEALAARLPVRMVRKAQGEEALVSVPSPGPAPDVLLTREELQSRAAVAREALLAALQELEAEDRLIVKLRYMDGLKVVQIARLMGADQKQLYRRIDRVLAVLRRTLQSRGVETATLFDDEEPWT
jgi:RNA polymerase sigma factor (sigma-70 family)